MDMIITLTVVMVSRMYTYVQTYQMVYINYIQFFVYKLYLKKAGEKIKRSLKTYLMV